MGGQEPGPEGGSGGRDERWRGAPAREWSLSSTNSGSTSSSCTGRSKRGVDTVGSTPLLIRLVRVVVMMMVVGILLIV
jgi:hypothetical protein